MSVANVMKMVKENEVKFVDFRFTDTKGKEQHVSVPVKAFGEDKFTEGMFDGSSIAGWKGIEASDMLLMPDATTAFVDPFFDEPTLVLTCDVIEPSTGRATTEIRVRWRAARSVFEIQRHRRHRLLWPGTRVLHFFRFRRMERGHVGQLLQVFSEAAWSSGEKFEGGNLGHRPAVKGGYFQCHRSISSRTSFGHGAGARRRGR